MANSHRKLTPSQQKFVDAYIANGGNHLQAYKDAGYKTNSNNSLYSGAHRLLTLSKVKNEIKRLKSEIDPHWTPDSDFESEEELKPYLPYQWEVKPEKVLTINTTRQVHISDLNDALEELKYLTWGKQDFEYATDNTAWKNDRGKGYYRLIRANGKSSRTHGCTCEICMTTPLEISPWLSQRDMYTWMKGYINGIESSRKITTFVHSRVCQNTPCCYRPARYHLVREERPVPHGAWKSIVKEVPVEKVVEKVVTEVIVNLKKTIEENEETN